MKKQNITVNGIPVEFTYTNEVTPIEHIFLKGHFENRNYDKLIDYLEDCVLWKRQFYFDPKKPKRGKPNGF